MQIIVAIVFGKSCKLTESVSGRYMFASFQTTNEDVGSGSFSNVTQSSRLGSEAFMYIVSNT